MHFRMLFTFTLLIVLCTGAGLAQTTSGSLTGSVTDPQQAAVANATVTATEETKNFLALPDFVGRHGTEDFDFSMQALRFFTAFGSSEFGVREFLRRDPERALAIMESWSREGDEHVRRLASEGSRPRLPWSFRLEAIVKDPSLTASILESLKADPSLYVRRSVANHLNDVTKDHPDYVFARLATWPLEDPHTAWIAKRALRTLIKKGDRRALAVIGAPDEAKVQVTGFVVKPRSLKLGERLDLSFTLKSKSGKPQRLVVDYIVHYVKKSGAAAPKVFKLKELTLEPGASIRIARSQVVKDFTTRVHYPGLHAVEIVANGKKVASGSFRVRP